MNFFFKMTRVFAYFSLFFAGFNFAAKAQTESVHELAAGTKIVVSMDNEINSKVSSANDTFTATLKEPLLIREVVALPAGTVFEGKITSVERAAAGGKNGKISVSFDTLRLPDGTKRAIEGVLVDDLEARGSRAKSKALTIAGAAAAGGIVGALSKTSSGALLGAGAGTAFALLLKGRDLYLRADEKFEIKLAKNVTLPAQDY